MYQQLITAQQLFNLSHDENLIILDASIPPITGMAQPNDCWPKTIIKNARQFNINKEFSDQNNPLPHSMPTEQQFTEQAQKLGVNKKSQIVVYDHFGLFSSARVWWMFKAMGHENVAVLNGGLPAWIQLGLTTTVAETSKHDKGNFIGCYQGQYFCNSKQVLQAIDNQQIQIVDARSSGRFLGLETEPRKGMRSGHIPSAVNLHYKQLQQNDLLVNKEQLAQHFSKAGIYRDQLFMSCGSGVTACILALAADILGYRNIRVYDGSWSEWGASSTLPVET